MRAYKKTWARRFRLFRVTFFMTSNILMMLSISLIFGYLLFFAIMRHGSWNEVGFEITLLISSILLALSGLAQAKERKSTDNILVRVFRGKVAYISGIQIALFGIVAVISFIYIIDIIGNKKNGSQFQRFLSAINSKVMQTTSDDHDQIRKTIFRVAQHILHTSRTFDAGNRMFHADTHFGYFTVVCLFFLS